MKAVSSEQQRERNPVKERVEEGVNKDKEGNELEAFLVRGDERWGRWGPGRSDRGG